MTHQPMTRQPSAAERATLDERARFKRHFPMLILDEEPDAWGRPRFCHSHVESIWTGWKAHAEIGRAPAGDACDSERLNFLARHGAFLSWSADRSCCAVFRYDDEGRPESMTKWGDNWPTARQAIDAAIDAQRRKGGAA